MRFYTIKLPGPIAALVRFFVERFRGERRKVVRREKA
ncbi:MAG: stage V sporulation protein M [Brockia lithotrophica]|nr:stage V sporulation protein M [Brockia lithotrophica]MBT9252417.1 stage V sporulation protein M [Brockia lithotrophica]MBT9253929.1 stage V sporulation protein M [Brockia lithotrophica]MBT9253930.1 stage V sporulation protein M [Brockia lithotrophica]